MYQDNKYIEFKNRIKEAEEILKEINFEEINDAGPRIKDDKLIKQFNIINNNKKPKELYYKLVDFMNPKDEDMVLTGNYDNVTSFLSKKRFDELAVECLMMERFLEFGMYVDLYPDKFEDLAPMPRVIADCIHYGLLHTLIFMFSYDDEVRNNMIAAFFNYSYRIPEITDEYKDENLSYLDTSKEYLEEYYYNKLKEKKAKRDNNFNSSKKIKRL